MHCLFRAQWDCSNSQSCKRLCHQDWNKFLALMLYNPGWSAVVSFRTCICNSKPSLWAVTARSCSTTKTPQLFSRACHGHKHSFAHGVRVVGLFQEVRSGQQGPEGSCLITETHLHGQFCEGLGSSGKNTSNPHLERDFFHHHSTALQQMCAKACRFRNLK